MTTDVFLGDGTGTLPWLPGCEPRPGRLARARLSSPAQIPVIERHRIEELLPAGTILGCLEAAAAAAPGKPAMIALESADLAVPPRVLSYRDLVEAIRRAAAMFADLAGGETPSVAIILPMIPEGLICSYAAASCGIATPINPFLELHHIAGILRSSRANILVTTDDQVWRRIAPLRDQVPTLRHVLLVGAVDRSMDFEERQRAYPAGGQNYLPVDPAEVSVHLPTGGTTAAPKLARLTQKGLLTVAWVVGTLMGPRLDGVVGHAMPNFHVGGLCTIALRTLLYGQTLLTLTRDGFRNAGVIRNFWDIARHYRMTSVLSTPTTAAALLACREAVSDGHVLEDYHCGGSTVPIALMHGFHDRFGVWLRENWGMTELHGTMTGHPNDGSQPVIGSVGCTLPFFRTKAVIVSDDNLFERDCEPGERGVLVLGGPTVMPGYVDPSLDAAYLIEGMPDGQPWGNTGDIGMVDTQGHVWLYGRSKDVIIRGGHNIDPKPVEELIAQFPGIQLAAMVGRPDPSKGEMPVAYIQAEAGAAVDVAALMRFCAEHVHERAALPAEVIQLAEMPLTAVGKIAKPALRIDIVRRTVEALVREHVDGAIEADVSVDSSGRRPKVTVRLACASPTGLARALAAYEFESEVVVSSAPRSAVPRP